MFGSSVSQLLRDPVALAYVAGWRVVGKLPRRMVLKAAYCGADWACQGGRGGEQLRRNLSRVVGPENVTRGLVRAAMRSYARYWVEAFCLPRMARSKDLAGRLNAAVTGIAHLEASQDAGKGVILTLPHSGNWDMAGVWLVHHSGGFTTVAEKLKPEALFQAFVDFRSSLGFRVLGHHPQPGEPGPFTHLKEVLQQGGTVALLGERDLKQHGAGVSFFGEPATFPAGPALLAIQTGAALHVVDAHFTPSGWGFSISEALEVTDVAETTQRIADRFAAGIAAHPADWHMLQPLWLADLPPRYRSATTREAP
ncbi:phosphatidylinositol mannoside acyltransferase [Staphylococcus chromogenes]|nr:phosphatidylinositol mannoside acyltransferase [Staphylococcus chromogenes]